MENKHGNETHGKSLTAEYKTWVGMKGRCNNPNFHSYSNYGGRGIKVCESWNRFECFFDDMGLKPTPQHQIDRIDNNGDYTPANCHWVTNAENQQNKRNSMKWIIDGVEYSTSRLAAKALGVHQATICRYYTGTPVYDSNNNLVIMEEK